MTSFLFPVLVASSLAFAQGPVPAPQSKVEQTTAIQWDVKIPMRDGVKLAAVVYRPREETKPLPVILCITPYTSANPYHRGRYFSQNGYVFVSVDIRGRGNSEGVFDPLSVQDGKDGYDLVEWLAKQPWCDGKVGMWGGSYAGFAQWATAKEFPPHLATIVPVASPHVFRDYPTNKGIDAPYNAQWMVLTGGRTDQDKAFGDDPFWSASYAAFAISGLPFRKIDQWAGLASPAFQRWMDRPQLDAGWEATVPSEDAYCRLSIPILTITGHYDDDQVSAMAYYRNHLRLGDQKATDRHYLVMGPWDHVGTRTPAKEVEGVAFGDASMLNMNALHKAWYDWTLKGGPKPEFLKQRVACYVSGTEGWTYANRLEDLTRETRRYHLQSGSGKASLENPGHLVTSQPAHEPLGTLVHDPLDPAPSAWEQTTVKGGKLTQPNAAQIFSGRQFLTRSLVFRSEPLPDGTTISGSPRFLAWVRMDVPDADFFVALFEVKADGSVIQLTQDILRARYREGINTEKLATPGEIVRLDFNDFLFHARRLAKGSRLKLAFGCIDTVYAQKNYHSGKAVVDEMPKDARVAHVQVLNDADHSAMLLLPLAQAK